MGNGLVLLARFGDGVPSLWVVSESVAEVTRLITCPARQLGVRVGDEVVVTLRDGTECRHNVMAVTDNECCLGLPYHTYIPRCFDHIPPAPVKKRSRMEKDRQRKIRYSDARSRLAKMMGMQFYALRRREEGKSLPEIAELMELSQKKVRWLISSARSYRPVKFCTTDVYADYIQQLKDADLLP